MIAVRTLGTIYLDGQPVEPDSEYRWEKSWKEIREEQIPWYPSIDIGDTDLAYPITWFPVGNLLVPTQNLLIGVHWNDLVANDLALAKNIIIDGLPYRLRLFQVGKTFTEMGEWGQFFQFAMENGLDLKLEPYDIWVDSPADREGFKSCAGCYGREPHVYCGRAHPKTWDGMAWRPVLEPICARLTHDLIGKRLGIWTKKQELVSGRLVRISPFSITLADGEFVPKAEHGKSRCVRERARGLAVSKSGIFSIQVFSES